MTRFALLVLPVTLLLLWGKVASSDIFEGGAFTIELSENWDSNPTEMGDAVLFYSLPSLGPQACLIISVQKTSELSTSDLLEATKTAIKEEFPNASFLLEREVKQDGAMWRELIYAHSGMEFLQILTVREGYAYIFTAAILEELFRNRLPEFRQIFSTWQFR